MPIRRQPFCFVCIFLETTVSCASHTVVIEIEIEWCTQGTPNGFKASITLEEVGAKYKVVELSFSENQQKSES